jgi:hypothetical protein
MGRALRRLLVSLPPHGAPAAPPPPAARPNRAKLAALRRRGLVQPAGTGWTRTPAGDAAVGT